jgi:hypothetical protein
MGGRRADQLQPSSRLERAEGGGEVSLDLLEQAPQAEQPGPPEAHQRKQESFAGDRERGGGLVTGGEALSEEGFHLGAERRTGELAGEHGREADRDRRGHPLVAQAPQGLQQRQIAVEHCLTDPVAAVRPAPVVEDVRKMAVKREDEIRRHGGAHREAAA